MDKNTLKSIFDKICVKLHNEGIGNLDIAYLDYDDSDDSFAMKPVFITFKDRDLLEYFKLAFTSDCFELKPTMDNPLADPNLMATQLYIKVKDYYLQWQRQQLPGVRFGSQGNLARTYAREDAKQTASLAKLAASGDALGSRSALGPYIDGMGARVFDPSKAAVKVSLGTASHTSAPWDDPLKQQTYIDNLYREEIYRRKQIIEKAIELLKSKKHFRFFYTNTSGDYEIGSGKIHINCRISLSNEFPFVPMSSKIVSLNFDIPERMFSPIRHQFDDSVHIPLQEAKLTDSHLILRIAYIIYQTTKLRENERITNEVIYINKIRHTTDPMGSFESLTFAF